MHSGYKKHPYCYLTKKSHPDRRNVLCMDREQEIPRNDLGGLLHLTIYPPTHCPHKALGNMVNKKATRDIPYATNTKRIKAPIDQLDQPLTEVSEEQLVVLTGKEVKKMIIVTAKMPEQMKEYRLIILAGGVDAVHMCQIARGVKHVAKKLRTQLTQKIILSFKMRIKGGTPNVSPFDDLTDRNC